MAETTIVNLQNTPTPDSVTCEAVSFDNGSGVTLKGCLYKPKNGSNGGTSAAIVTGAWTTVKEQMPGTYARELAAGGLVALAFDFTGWGESTTSEAGNKYVEDPTVKTADIVAAAKYLQGLTNVADKSSGGVSGLGICASSWYMAAAVADHPDLFDKVALVAPWLHDPPMAEAIYGGPEAATKLLAAANDAEEEMIKNGKDPDILVCGSTTDKDAIMFGAPYYSEEHRGLIAAYDNKFNVLSWKPWLTYDGQASADRLGSSKRPLLMVGSESIALLQGAKNYEERATKAGVTVEKVWLGPDVTQFDFYDREDAVTAAADAVASFFGK